MSSLTRTIMLAALVVAPAASALTLGPVVVHSHIGQPFQASIAVHGAHGHVQAHMAPRAAFRAAGMTPPGRNTVYRCRVMGRAGHQRIVVTSRAPVEHPDVTLLLVVDSAHGSRVQELHAALHPVLIPTMHVQSGVEPTMMPSARRDLGAPPGPPSLAPSQSPYRAIGPIRSGESLLDAARAMDPGHHNLGPLMEALVRTNPGAFVDANANGLRVGAVLHRPNSSVVRTISSTRALHFLRAQYTAWVRAHARHSPSAHHAVAHKATVIPAVRPTPLVSHPLKPTSPIKDTPLSPANPPAAPTTITSTPMAPLSLVGLTQASLRPIPEANGYRSSPPALVLPTTVPTATGAAHQTAPVTPHPDPTPSVPAVHTAPPHATYGGIPIHQLVDLAILIIAVLGVRQFVWSRRTDGTFLRGPLARLFARPSGGETPTPATPAASAPTEPARIPSYETPVTPSAAEPLRSEGAPAHPQASTGSSLVVAVAHRDDQILKLDLARAYADMGEIAAARELLTQVRAYLDGARKPALDDHSHG